MGAFPLLLAASLAGPGTTSTIPPSDPVRPALWVVQDGDTTIYLFGTFHALDGATHWFKGGVKSAFDQSDQLVLETLVPKPGQAPPALSIPRTPVALRPSLIVGRLAPSASFVASTQTVMSASRKRGMSIAHGADAALRLAADAAGKPVDALESFDAQLGMFKSLGAQPQPQPQPRNRGLQAMALSAVLARLQDAWVRGDTSTFVPMLEQMRAQTPATYRAMFVERNARWASWIAERMERPGTVFVAVGAGHLAGRDSVQSQLAAIGVGSYRIN